MQLAVGDRALFEFPPLGDRFVGVVTESDPESGIVAYVSTPVYAAGRILANAPVIVLFAREGRLLGFRARVEESHYGSGTTVRLLPKGYPEDMDVRSEPRAMCSFPATLTNGKDAHAGFLVDMSTSAARMRLNPDEEIPEVGAHAVLRFRVFGAGDEYEVSCSVYRRFVKEDVPHAVLTFDDPAEDFCRAVAEYIEYQRQAGALNPI
jgi:hypothetical protein